MGNDLAFIYVFLRADGKRKVGTSTDWTRRRWELNGTSCQHTLEACWIMGDYAARRVEICIHAELERMVGIHPSYEVYDLPLSPIIACVYRAMAKTAPTLRYGLDSKSVKDWVQPVSLPPAPTFGDHVREFNEWAAANPVEFQSQISRMRLPA